MNQKLINFLFRPFAGILFLAAMLFYLSSSGKQVYTYFKVRQWDRVEAQIDTVELAYLDQHVWQMRHYDFNTPEILGGPKVWAINGLYRYQYKGEAYKGRHFLSQGDDAKKNKAYLEEQYTKNAFQNGQRVQAYVNPEKPKRSYLVNDFRLKPFLIQTFLMLCFIAFCEYLQIRLRHQRRRMKGQA